MDGLGSAGEVHVVGDLPLDGLADRHRRRLGWRDLLGRFGLGLGFEPAAFSNVDMGTRSGLTACAAGPDAVRR